MTNTTIALVFVMVVNVLMFVSNVAILDLNPDGPKFYNCKGSVMQGFGSDCSNTSVLNSDIASQLPSSQSIEVSTNPFTDIFNNALGWFIGLPGINYIVAIASSPYNIIKAIGLPNELTTALGILWYGITLFCIVAFLWGRE